MKKKLFLYVLIIVISGCKTDDVNLKPEAIFDFYPTDSLSINDTIKFSNHSKNAKYYMWTFGDGGISSIEKPLHTYKSAGIYQIRLHVRNDNYFDTISKIIYINSTPLVAKPTACFDYIPISAIKINNPVKFTNCSLNSKNFYWDFGDGTTSSEYEPSHSYKVDGTYIIKLKATSNQLTDSVTKSITILADKYIYVTGYIGYGDLALGALVWENSKCSILSYQSASNKATNITFQNNDKYIVGFFNGSYYSKNGAFTLLDSWEASGTDYITNTNGIAVSNGNVYVSGNDCGLACYWNNGTKSNLCYISDYATNICVSNNDIYVSGNSGQELINSAWTQGQYAIYWKNKNKTILGTGKTFDITISNNDVYVVGTNNNKAVYWKNGTEIILPEGVVAKSIQISGQDVYIVGNNNNSAICWKNGTALYLSYLDYMTEATSVFVDGKDVYVAGMVSKTGMNHKAVYWKNGECVVLPFSDSNYSSTDIYVR